MLLPSENPIKSHEEFISLEAMFLPKTLCVLRNRRTLPCFIACSGSLLYIARVRLIRCCCCCCCFSIQRILVANPKKTTLHGGQSRSWSAEQGKEKKKKKSLAARPPPPPTLLVRRKQKKITRRIRMSRRYAGWRCASLGPSRVRTRIPTTRRLGQWVSLRKTVCDSNFPSLVASLFSWRCLAASSSSSLHAAMNLRPLRDRLNPHLSL